MSRGAHGGAGRGRGGHIPINDRNTYYSDQNDDGSGFANGFLDTAMGGTRSDQPAKYLYMLGQETVVDWAKKRYPRTTTTITCSAFVGTTLWSLSEPLRKKNGEIKLDWWLLQGVSHTTIPAEQRDMQGQLEEVGSGRSPLSLERQRSGGQV